MIKLSRGRSVGLCIGLSSALWKNGRSDPDAVWHHRLDGSRDEAGSGVWGSVHGKGYFGANLGRAIVKNGDFTAPRETFAATRSFSLITLSRLVNNPITFLTVTGGGTVASYCQKCNRIINKSA